MHQNSSRLSWEDYTIEPACPGSEILSIETEQSA